MHEKRVKTRGRKRTNESATGGSRGVVVFWWGCLYRPQMISLMTWTATKSEVASTCRHFGGATTARAAHQTDRESWIVAAENTVYVTVEVAWIETMESWANNKCNGGGKVAWEMEVHAVQTKEKQPKLDLP